MARHLERLSLYLLLIVVALRPLIEETYHTAQTGVSAALSQVAGPMPVRTLAIDAVIMAAALLWLVARAKGSPGRYRHCGIEWGAVLLVVAGIISCRVAGNQRAAIDATVDWLCLPLLTIVLVQLLRDWWHIRLTLCVVLATAAVQAYKCARQVYYELPETERWYEEHKPEIWAAPDAESDSPQVALYERRIYGREATGFLTHSNVTGAYLVMTGLAALALAWARWTGPAEPFRRPLAAAVGLLAAGLLAAAVLTRSRGALAAGAVSIVLCLLARRFAQWFESHRARGLVLGWALVVAAALGTVGYGTIRGGLPGASLNFRWQYWTASWDLFADWWATGVGRENFGDHYLAYKSIASPEEVSNPHNLLVAAATEWGALGAIGLLAMLVGGSIAATRPTPRIAHAPTAPGGRWLAWGVTVCAATFGIRLFLLGTDLAAYLIDATVLPVIVWMVTFALLCTESNRWPALGNQAMLGLATLINFALLAFLLQDTINFALFVPGAATTLFALAAVPIACRSISADGMPTRRDATAWLLVVVMGLVLLAHVQWWLRPVAHSNAELARARGWTTRVVDGEYFLQPAHLAYMRAAGVDPLDPTPWAEDAGFLMSFAESVSYPADPLLAAFGIVDAAIQRDPYSTKRYRQKVRMCGRAFALTGDERYLLRALEPARRVVELYPQSPDAHADLGTALLEAGKTTMDDEMLSQALQHLTWALELDEARPDWEELRRMSVRRRQTIENQIAEAQLLLSRADE